MDTGWGKYGRKGMAERGYPGNLMTKILTKLVKNGGILIKRRTEKFHKFTFWVRPTDEFEFCALGSSLKGGGGPNPSPMAPDFWCSGVLDTI